MTSSEKMSARGSAAASGWSVPGTAAGRGTITNWAVIPETRQSGGGRSVPAHLRDGAGSSDDDDGEIGAESGRRKGRRRRRGALEKPPLAPAALLTLLLQASFVLAIS